MPTRLEEIYLRIQNLAPAQQEALSRLLDSLVDVTASKDRPRRSLSEAPYFGMWRDREDMRDSVEWVRRIRESEWRS
jgi:hypothetical protein